MKKRDNLGFCGKCHQSKATYTKLCTECLREKREHYYTIRGHFELIETLKHGATNDAQTSSRT